MDKKELALKKIFVSVFAAAVALSALTGCTRTSYAIHTNDGRTIVSDGKPKRIRLRPAWLYRREWCQTADQ